MSTNLLLFLGVLACAPPAAEAQDPPLTTPAAWQSVQAHRVIPADSQPLRKSPFLAGFLSLLLPGTGSLYAGNIGHGVRHLVAIPLIVGASIGLTYAGAFSTSDDLDAGDFTPLFIGGGLLLINGAWAIVTAERDARAYNRHIDAAARTASAPPVPASFTGVPSQPLLKVTALRWRI